MKDLTENLPPSLAIDDGEEELIKDIFGKDYAKIERFTTNDAAKPTGLSKGFLSHKGPRSTLDNTTKLAKKDTWLIKTMSLDKVFREYLATQLMRYLTNNVTPKARLHIRNNNIELAIKYLPDSISFPKEHTSHIVKSVDQNTYFEHLALSMLICDDDPVPSNWVSYNMSLDVKVSRIDFGNSFLFDPTIRYRHYYQNLHSFLEWFLDRMLVSRGYFLESRLATDPLFIKALKSLENINIDTVRHILIKSAENFYEASKAISKVILCNDLESILSIINMEISIFNDPKNLTQDNLIKIVDQITNKIEQNRANLVNLSCLLEISHHYCNDDKYDILQYVDQVKDILKHISENEHGQYLRFAYLMFRGHKQKLRFSMALTIMDMDNIFAGNNYVEKIYADIYFHFTQDDVYLTAQQLNLDEVNKSLAYNKFPRSISKIKTNSYFIFMDPKCREAAQLLANFLHYFKKHPDFHKICSESEDILYLSLANSNSYLDSSVGMIKILKSQLYHIIDSVLWEIINNRSYYEYFKGFIELNFSFCKRRFSKVIQSKIENIATKDQTAEVTIQELKSFIKMLADCMVNYEFWPETIQMEWFTESVASEINTIFNYYRNKVKATDNTVSSLGRSESTVSIQINDEEAVTNTTSLLGGEERSTDDTLPLAQGKYTDKYASNTKARSFELNTNSEDDPTVRTEGICSFVARLLCCRAKTEAGQQL